MKHLPTPQPNRSRFAMVFLLFMTFLLGSVQGWGQVTTLTNWTNLYNNTANYSGSITIPAGSGSNRLLLVGVASSQSGEGARTVTAAIGGQTLTAVSANDLASTGTRQHTAFFYLKESELDAASNSTLSVNFSGETVRVNTVWFMVLDNVDQASPIEDSKNYNSGTNTTSSPAFSAAMNVGQNNLALSIISSIRSSNTSPRTINVASSWSIVNNQTWTTTDGVRNAVLSYAIPSSSTSVTSSGTISSATLASMSGITVKSNPPALPAALNGVITSSSPNTYSYTFPAFVKGFEVEAWGAGGGGGGASRASGGGGGAFAKSYLVNAGTTYSITLGAGGAGGASGVAGVNGGNTIFGSSEVVAEGGKKGTNGNSSGSSTGVGGGTTISVGTVEYAGGTGGLGRSGGSTGRGGGGGSSAGTASNGNNGVVGGSGSAAAGGAAVTNGGAGGIGGDNDNGGNGSTPGGGGGGASDSGIGGTGGNGQIRLTYVDISNLTVASTPIVVCNNSTATITLNSTSLANGNYYVYYSTTWSGTTTVQSKVYMTFNSGTTAGTFTTVALPNAGSYTITITRIENSSETDIYSEPTSALTKAVTVRAAFTSGIISSTGETICSGGTPGVIGNTTASSGGDDVITYSWRSSADSYVAPISGATSSTYTPPSGLTATTSYRRYAKDGTCNTTATVSAGTWTVTVRPEFTSGTISSTGQTICSGGTPSVIGSTTASSGGDNSITYSWRSSADSYVAAISGATSSTYTPPSGLTATTSYRRYAKDGTCNTTATVSTGTWTVTVNPNLPASVSIAASATTICAGTSVTFTATPTNGGTTPSYQWKVNGTNVGTNAATFTSTTLTNGAAVTCVMTSNASPCLTGSPATSNGVTMTVTANNTAGTASTTPTLCINTALTNITHTTTGATGIANAGTTGANGLPAGVAASWNGNTITVFGTPSASGTFNYSIPLTGGCGTVNATGTITVAAAPSAGILSGTQTLCSNGTTTLSSTVAGGTWVSSATGIATINSTSGLVSGVSAGSASMSYTVTGTGGCSDATAARIVTVTATTTYYADADGDGYGNASSVQAACSQPTGYVSNNTDCNDNSSSVNPGASETCNNSDDNCNGQNDEGASNSVSTFITACATYTWSVNNTTYTTSGNYTSGTGCNTQVLHLTINTPTLTYYVDADGDNFGTGAGSLFCANPGAGYSTANTDCNDASVSISPMAEELCDGIDNDCNASTADGLGTTTYFRDFDGDTFGDPNSTVVSCQAPNGYVANNTDCDDNNVTYHVINTYFTDGDNDGYGDAEAPDEACFITSGFSVNANDCDDTNAAVNPNATEICNQIDDDCDGLVNDGYTSVDYHFDGDGDGYGSGVAVLSCAPITNYVQNSADCNDSDAAINPNATEICGNTVDEDCNAGDLVPSYYTSRQSGAWTSASTWNKSCDNTTYDLALSAPQGNYAGIVTIASSHVVTVGINDAYVASAGNLNINATGSLIVNGKMSLSQTLVNNGTLTVNSGASFLQSSQTSVNTGNGAYVVNLNLTGASANGTAPNGRYWYLGSPMNNTNIYNTFYNPSTMTRVWDYLPTTNAWSPIINSSTGVGINSATNMAVGIGYLYRAGSAQSVTYNGTSSTFNNNVTTPLSFSGIGYKYVANPYTSHVDWKLLTRTGLNVSYWIRNAMNTSYESYNATSGISTNNGSGQTTQFIPPMQGFWIYAYTTPCSLRMDNGDRVHSSNALHSPMHNQVVRLNLNDGKSDDQAVVYENENASNGIEEYDTDKFMDENHHQVYFLEGTKEVSLDGLKDATAKQKVDMGIQITSAGTYTITAVELGVEEDVVLEDKFTHNFQDMKLNNTYSFTSNAGNYNNRFVLHFTLNPQTETAMETVEVGETVGETEGVNIYTTIGQQVKVWVTNTAEFQNATVKVYDAIGNLIERKNMTSSELLLDLDTATGVYLVEVTGANKTFTKKVFIGK